MELPGKVNRAGDIDGDRDTRDVLGAVQSMKFINSDPGKDDRDAGETDSPSGYPVSRVIPIFALQDQNPLRLSWPFCIQ